MSDLADRVDESLRGKRPAGACVSAATTRENELTWRCSVPSFLLGSLDAGKVDEMRRAAIIRRDECVAMQKECGAERDASGAKFFKGEATDALKEYRAACLVLGYLVGGPPPGDAPFKRVDEWPVELAPWIDRVLWTA